MTTAMLFFLLKKNLDFYATMCHVCKNEEKLLERLDQAILDAIDKSEKTQQTTAIGTLF
jgi:predicted DCC family thiol-disulfide oxidoreductase YuxK